MSERIRETSELFNLAWSRLSPRGHGLVVEMLEGGLGPSWRLHTCPISWGRPPLPAACAPTERQSALSGICARSL